MKAFGILASHLLHQLHVELYELKLRGLSGPFNGREIIHLFRGGLLNSRVPCKLRGEGVWRTIGDFFPLLEYRVGSYSLPEEEAGLSRRIASFAVVAVVAIALSAGAGWLFWPRSGEKSIRGQAANRPGDTPSEAPLAVARN